MTLGFATVLREEYEALHPGEHVMVLEGDARWRFTDDDVLDVRPLLRRLAPGGTPSAAVDQYLVGLMTPEDQAALRAIEPDHPNDPRTRATLAAALNGLLTKSLDAPSLRALRSDPRIADLAARDTGALRLELNRLILERVYDGSLRTTDDRDTVPAYDKIRAKDHVALCLSGGGIRSATFALGVLQGLARANVLDKVQYLSTVSGGGYLGGWLSAWMAHTSPDEVITQLARGEPPPGEPEPRPIQHLRAYSNYLAPRVGLLTTDTWTLTATYLRNVLLNWLLLVPGLAIVLLVPRLCLAVIRITNDFTSTTQAWIVAGLAVAGGIFAGIAVQFVHTYRPPPSTVAPDARRRHRQDLSDKPQGQVAFLWHCLLFIGLCAAVLSTAWYWLTHWDPIADSWAHLGWARQLGVFCAYGALIHTIGWFFAKPAKRTASELAAVVLTGAAAGALAYGAATGVNAIASDRVLYIVLAWPAFVSAILVGGWLFVGGVGRLPTSDDASREWSARFSAWLLIVSITWLVLSALVLWVPSAAGGYIENHLSLAAIGTVASGWLTARLGWSPSTPSSPGQASKGMTASGTSALSGLGLAIIAPVFACTLVVLLSALDGTVVSFLCVALRPLGVSCGDGVLNASVGAVGAAFVAWGLVLIASAGTIDANKFSLHAMYRDRLIRAYLGASRLSAVRDPDPFTKFDLKDNLLMRELWPATEQPAGSRPPPLHVLNLALNLVTGEQLAWQERKAESFSVSALHAGSRAVGYRPTRSYGGRDGMTLGAAVTVSGAAASPNMGYHSSPAITFIMTLFNARLGAWLGNPGPAGDNTFASSSPTGVVGPLYAILSELFGYTNDRNPYVYLSDGGHFDNTGLYEMVLRRCQWIVVVDAGEDAKCTFSDLGEAIRKIRIDYGIPIEFDQPLAIYPRSEPERARIGRYGAVGSIRYSCIDPAVRDGTLIYIRPAFYGSEPRDVYEYAQRNPAFPHDSTFDQFFSESHFESYRALGSHIMEVICRPLDPDQSGLAPGSLEWLANQVRQYKPYPVP